jgi:YHS domain-containing protein
MYITYLQKIITSTFLTFFLTCFVHVFHAQLNIDKNKLAVSGYDLVDYFNGKASPGNENFLSSYKGANYLFKNEINKRTFEKSPEEYLPQYGGWCAYAMGYNGKKVEINPESFSIENKKLYLFYKTTFTDTKKKWFKSNEKLKSKANQNWNKQLIQ